MLPSGKSHAHLLTAGVAEFLAARGLASWDQWGEGTPYTAETTWPVFIGPEMPTSPDRCIILTPGVRTLVRANVDQAIQIRLRGLPYVAGNPDSHLTALEYHAQQIADAFYPNGFPLVHADLGGIRVGIVRPGMTSDLPLSQDGNRRHGHIQNIRIRVRRPRPE